MTTLRDAAQQALDVLLDICSDSRAAEMPGSRQHWMHCAIDDLRQALMQPEPCDMGDLCIGCTPRAGGVCPGSAQPRIDDLKHLQHSATVVSDWLAGGCDVQDIPRVQIALLHTVVQTIADGEMPSAPQPAPVAQPVEWLRALLDAVTDYRHEPEGMVRGGEYVRADALIEAASIAAPAAPAAQPSDEQIAKLAWKVGMGPAIVGGDDVVGFARAVLDLRPVAPPPNLACKSVQKRLAAQALPEEATPEMHGAYYECLSAGSGLDAAMVWRAMLEAARKGQV